MKHIRKFNESSNYQPDEIIYSGKTKSGWKFGIKSTDGSSDELVLTSESGEILDVGEILHEAVDAYINGDSSTEGFLVDVMDITEAYDLMKSKF
jgi:hypothetical protein